MRRLPVGKPALQGGELPVGKAALQGANLLVGKGALRDGISVGEGLSAAERHRLFGLYSEKIEGYLDAGRGECWLRDPRIGELVAGAQRFFDDQRYDLGPWVVMPNHVHVIPRPRPRYSLDEIVKSWKGFTACEANRMLKRTGCCFWAREYYDHLVRSDEERARLGDYIQDNPVKAGLCAQWQDGPWSSAHPRWR